MANVTQAATYINKALAEGLGTEMVAADDLSNIVDVGKEVTALDGWRNKILKSLVDQIGRVIFVNRAYTGIAPSVMVDGWRYGGIAMKVSTELSLADDNVAWELTDGTMYSQDVYHANKATEKFYDLMVTHSVERSIPDYQYDSAWKNADQAAGFVSMLETHVQNSLTLQNETLIRSMINTFAGRIINNGAETQVIKLLSLYNAASSESLTAEQALNSPEFLRFAIRWISEWSARMRGYSTLFNVEGKERFTPLDRQRIIYSSYFKNAVGVYLYNAAGQFNTNFLQIPEGDSVPYWQGSGIGYSLSDITTINATLPGGQTVNQAYVIAILYDEQGMVMANFNPRTGAHHNARADFTNYFHKVDARYMIDNAENGIVFVVA